MSKANSSVDRYKQRASTPPYAPAEELGSQPPALLTSSLEKSSFDVASRQQLIAEAAYLRAAQRGFEPGHELDDWLSAEGEVDQRLCIDNH